MKIPSDPKKKAQELADARKQIERLTASKADAKLIAWWEDCVKAYEAKPTKKKK